MFNISPHIYLIGAFIAWAGLMLTWAKHIRDISEERRLKSVKRGEAAPDIKGVSNYERAELRDNAHRAMKVTSTEKWIGRALVFVLPMLIVILYIMKV